MLEQLPVGQAWELVERGGAEVVDLRPPVEFARTHPKGAISLPYSPRGLADRLAVVLAPGTRIILLASERTAAIAAITQLKGSRYPVLGVLEGSAWEETERPKESLREVGVEQLANAVSGRDLTVVDVREPMEWETGHVPGAILVSIGNVRKRLSTIPRHPPVAVICESGVRSSTAASILQAAGFPGVANVSAGTSGYRRAGFPLAFPDQPQRDGES